MSRLSRLRLLLLSGLVLVLGLAGPGALKTWDNWYLSPQALARRHNLVQFFSSLHVTVTTSSDPDFVVLRPCVLAALKALP